MNIRLDRTASVSVFHPLARWTNGRPAPRVPILMYHGVREGTSAKHPYYETNTSPAVFAQHMKFLSQNGYATLRLDDVPAYLSAGRPENRRAAHPVVITFDDGYRDFYRQAYPMLARYRFTATVFPVTGAITDPRSKFNGADCLTWNELRELHAHGIGIGSHTVSHPELRFLSLSALDDELTRSKQAIEEAIGDAVRSFACPYAFPEADRAFVTRLTGRLETRGYQIGVSTIIGTANRDDQRFLLPRLPINTWDDLSFFQAKLEGGYDWLHFPQWLTKKLTNPAAAVRPSSSLGAVKNPG